MIFLRFLVLLLLKSCYPLNMNTYTQKSSLINISRACALKVALLGLIFTLAGCDPNNNQINWHRPQPKEIAGGLPYIDCDAGHKPRDPKVAQINIKKKPIVPPKPKVIKPITKVVGKSVEGRSIKMTTFNPGKTKPIFIFAGIHGEERASAAVATKLIAYLKKNPKACKGKTVVIIDRVNPDGLRVGRRVNDNGVDLNRNFPAKNFKSCKRFGRKPLCEPEARMIYNLTNKLKPAVIISIHTCRRGRHGNNWDGNGKKYADAMSKYNKYRSFGTWHNETPGSFGSWAGVDQKYAVVTLEIPNDLTNYSAWKYNRSALLEVIKIAPKGK